MKLFRRTYGRRRQAGRGFSLIEMLVALAVSTLTLSLLTGAGWSLQRLQPAQAEVSGTLDRLVARRIFQGWLSAAHKPHPERPGAFEGTATRLLFRTKEGDLMRLAIDVVDGQSVLTAARATQVSDIRVFPEATPRSVLLTTQRGLRLSYLMPLGPDTVEMGWRYQVGEIDNLPAAIALELGTERIAVVPVRATVAGPCLVTYGPSAEGVRACALR